MVDGVSHEETENIPERVYSPSRDIPFHYLISYGISFKIPRLAEVPSTLYAEQLMHSERIYKLIEYAAHKFTFKDVYRC
jgi:hypothetical protein